MTAAPYPITFQRETAPSWLNYAAALGGGAARDLSRPFRALELGCGRGYSALLHAAAHPAGEFHAVDRDTDAVAQAQGWADAAGIRNVRFHAASFEMLPALGPFDFIVLHGVYSWVGAQVRATLRDALRDRLAPGGLAYVSYNCLPGWAGELPLRRLLNELDTGNGAGDAARTLERLRACGLAYFKAHPAAERAVRSWADQPEAYLAQEYMADACEALWSVDVTAEMAEAGLAWIASATLRDQHQELLVDDETARAIAGLATARRRTLALDFAVNRSFRRDVFVRGAARRDGVALDALVIGGGDIPESIMMPRGRIGFQADFIAALQHALADGALTLGAAVAALGEPRGEVARNLLWLIAAGALTPLPPCPAAAAAARQTLRLLGVSPAA